MQVRELLICVITLQRIITHYGKASLSICLIYLIPNDYLFLVCVEWHPFKNKYIFALVLLLCQVKFISPMEWLKVWILLSKAELVYKNMGIDESISRFKTKNKPVLTVISKTISKSSDLTLSDSNATFSQCNFYIYLYLYSTSASIWWVHLAGEWAHVCRQLSEETLLLWTLLRVSLSNFAH